MRPLPLNEKTSARLAKQRQRQTKGEEAVGSFLRKNGLRYRRNVTNLPGSPDFANTTKRWAIFVNGCFWHHHRSCHRATVPRNNEQFWRAKFEANRRRDARAIVDLRASGFRVVIVWECQLGSLNRRLGKILKPRGIKT